MMHRYQRLSRGLLLAGCVHHSIAQAQSPAVVSSGLSPARNAGAAPRTAPVVIPFSQPIDPATAGNIRIFSSQSRGRRTATASTSGSTVTLTPTASAGQLAAFKPGETVMVTVPTTVRSQAGVAAAKQVHQFTANVSRAGAGNFQQGFIGYVAPAALSSVTLGDVDGDGDLDVLVTAAGASSGVVKVYLNDGSGTYGTMLPDVSVGQGPRSVLTGDVDGDGDLDLLTASQGGNTVSVRLNNGSGTFSGGQDVAFANQPYCVALGDMDGDADLDVVALVYDFMGTSNASVRLNDGSGNFGGSQDVLVGRYARSVALGDLDGDGDVDVLAASYSLGVVNVLLNDGNGLLSSAPSVAVASQPIAVAAADVDGDGDLDLLATNAGPVPGSVSVRLNNGSGLFSGSQDVSTGIRPVGAAVGDVDGDGDLDLFTLNANNGSSTASIRLNDGTGRFTSRPDVPVTNATLSAALGDVDGDGDLDWVAAGNFVSINLNQLALATVPKSSAAVAFSLYPNPAIQTDAINVRLAASAGIAEAHATVYNALGQLMASAQLPVQAGQATGSLPTAGLVPGVYTVRLQAGATVVAQRLMIQ